MHSGDDQSLKHVSHRPWIGGATLAHVACSCHLWPNQKRFQSPLLVCKAMREYKLQTKAPRTMIKKTQMADLTTDFSRYTTHAEKR
jgi:hypothetical protein